MQDTCFVLMPFKAPFNEYYSEIYKPAIEKRGLKCVRADEIFGTRTIIADIFDSIKESKILIAELSEQNPNVAYELGIAHSLGKPVIMVVNDSSQIPFDLKHLRTIVYDTTRPKWSEKLEDELKNTILSVEKNPKKQLAINPKHLNSNMLPSVIKNMLLSTFKGFEGLVSKEVYTELDEKCNAISKHRGTQISKNKTTHLIFDVYLDTKGRIKMLSATNSDDKKDLEYFTIDETESSHTFAIIYDQPIEKDTNMNYEFEIYAENYFEKLLTEGIASLCISPYYKLKFNSLRDVYTFPKTQYFSTLKAIFIKHPQKKIVGKSILPSNQNDKLVFDFNYGDLSKYNSEIILEFRI